MDIVLVLHASSGLSIVSASHEHQTGRGKVLYLRCGGKYLQGLMSSQTLLTQCRSAEFATVIIVACFPTFPRLYKFIKDGRTDRQLHTDEPRELKSIRLRPESNSLGSGKTCQEIIDTPDEEAQILGHIDEGDFGDGIAPPSRPESTHRHNRGWEQREITPFRHG